MGLDLPQVFEQALGCVAAAALLAGDAPPEEAGQGARSALEAARVREDALAGGGDIARGGVGGLQDGRRPVDPAVGLGLAGGEPGIELLGDAGLAPAGGGLQRDPAGLTASLDLFQDLQQSVDELDTGFADERRLWAVCSMGVSCAVMIDSNCALAAGLAGTTQSWIGDTLKLERRVATQESTAIDG